MNKQFLKKERLEAMKAKDVLKKDLLGSLIADLDRDFDGKEPSEKDIFAAIKKLIKGNQEIINTGLGDLNIINTETAILEGYLPKQMSEDDVKLLIQNVASENPDIVGGRLIGLCVQAANGTADSKLISKLVMQLQNEK